MRYNRKYCEGKKTIYSLSYHLRDIIYCNNGIGRKQYEDKRNRLRPW